MESEIKTKSALGNKSQGQNQVSRTIKYQHSDKAYMPESEHAAASSSQKGRLHKSIRYFEYVGEVDMSSLLSSVSGVF